MSIYGFLYGGSSHESDKQRNPKGFGLLTAMIKWHWGKLIGLNLLFIVSCLPVVTIPCAMTAMSRVLGLFLQRRICYPVHDYWKAFKGEWKRSLSAGWILIGVMVLSVLGMWFYPRAIGGAAGTAAGGACLVVGVLALSATIYLFPMIAFTDLKPLQLFKNALLLVLVRLPQTVLALSAVVAVLVVTYVGMPVTVLVMPVFGFSLIGLIGVFSGWGALKQYVIKDEHEHQAE